jgi:hypothetical protein
MSYWSHINSGRGGKTRTLSHADIKSLLHPTYNSCSSKLSIFLAPLCLMLSTSSQVGTTKSLSPHFTLRAKDAKKGQIISKLLLSKCQSRHNTEVQFQNKMFSYARLLLVWIINPFSTNTFSYK